jgi:predicted NUDIX family NTP pyrophosphohydrolase
MRAKTSAGILLYRIRAGECQFLLVHPGGPFWARKDKGAWTIPKGEVMDGEEPFKTAMREFREELGELPHTNFLALSPVRQKAGKLVLAWAAMADFDISTFKSNTFQLEWPPKSGTISTFPEIDRVEWFGFDEAVGRINPAQIGFLRELKNKVDETTDSPGVDRQ